MEELIGDRLKKENHLTDEQIQSALERQRLHGGRIGSNLVALGYITEDELSHCFHHVPGPPQSLDDSGLGAIFVTDLVMKHLFYLHEFDLYELAERIKLPISVLDRILNNIRNEHLIEAMGSSGLTSASFRYKITDQGKARGKELLDISRYVGPAPVSLIAYQRMVEMQTVKNIIVDEADIRQAFAHLIIDEQKLRSIGPAVSSGRAIFLYGPPGNGKTAIAETISKILPDKIFIPYAILVGNDVITLYDPVNHVVNMEGVEEGDIDPRWLQVKRPTVMAGGELTLSMLDLDFNPIAKYYEAPLQMKANNGLFIVDDFGRQQMNPQDLLNRWIVPLERRTDFLALQSGMKFEMPFDQLIVFSTNIEPKKLVDEAFLRRIRYKILIDHPSQSEYAQIFQQVCESNAIPFQKEMLDYLFDNFYSRAGVKMNACHPRDIIDHIIDDAHYRNHKPELSRESLNAAWDNYFVEL